jgi:hypothetical protein
MERVNGDGRQAVIGIITDGRLWKSGKLQEDLFTRNIESYTNFYERQKNLSR